eukprot:scaffold20948_cov37-Cyclotella_meneghiniana.AAC.2
MQTLEQIQDQLSPGNKMQAERGLERQLPRVQNIVQQLTDQAQQQPPRVQFEEPRRRESLQPSQMIVTSPRKNVVMSPRKEIVTPAPIIR